MTGKQFRMLAVLTVVSGLLGGAASNLLLRGGPAMAQVGGAVQEVVKAKKFQVVDDQGRIRAMLGFNADGSPGLALYDADGKPRTILSLRFDGGPFISLWDANGKGRTAIGCTETVNHSTGATVRTPEATIILFKDDGTIWQAP